MGLDTTHNAWHGAYSAFNRWRTEIARVAGLPPLDFMEGFYGEDYRDPIYWANQHHQDSSCPNRYQHITDSLPIKWDCLKPSPLHELLAHSDCDGKIAWRQCGRIANALEKLIPLLPSGEAGGHIGNWRDKTAQFVTGLRAAHKAKEALEFF